MRVLVTGGTGVLGRAFRPLAATAGHDVRAPGRAELDLFDPVAVASAVRDVNAVLHQPTVTFVYPGDRPVSEETSVGDVPVILRSALAAEQQAARFTEAGRRGVVLRLGLLDGALR